MRKRVLPVLMIIALILAGCGEAAALEKGFTETRERWFGAETIAFTAGVSAEFADSRFDCTLKVEKNGEETEEKIIEEQAEEQETEVTVLPMDPSLDKLSRFEGIMTNIFRQTLKDNNEELENRISDAVLNGMDVLLKLREEKEEERYRRLDESIRLHQNKGKMVAATREPRRFFLFRKHRI